MCDFLISQSCQGTLTLTLENWHGHFLHTLVVCFNPLTPKILEVILFNLLLPFSSCDISLENLVLDQPIIP